MSGLTMGLLSLDMMTLKVLKDGGTPVQKKHASRIIPLVKRHHLLLVTLLLANAAAVESMPIFLDRISDPITAICVSVTAVLIFGEVVPQAVCTRFGLAIGATLAPFVYLIIGVLFIISWPLSKLLDCILGKDHATFFRRAELKALVDLHGPNLEAECSDDQLTGDEVLIIKGALDMKNKVVKDAMVSLQNVYMLSVEDKMDGETMSEILQKTHSRIPVFEGTRDNIISVLLVKTLIKLDPDDATSVRDLLTTSCSRQIVFVNDNMPLFDLLNEFQKGSAHLAVVKRNIQFRKSTTHTDGASSDAAPLLGGYDTDDEDLILKNDMVIGIITLEDVIEELIQEEIMDETDIYADINKRVQVARAKASRTGHRNLINRSLSHPPQSGQHNTHLSCDTMAVTVSDSNLESAGLLDNQVLV